MLAPTARLELALDEKIVLVREAMIETSIFASCDEDVLAKAIQYHISAGGKKLRARISLAAAHELAVEPGDAIAIASCCELLHNASLIHDDLQDRDEYRRGQPAVWRAFGDNVALLAGDLLLSAAYHAVAGIGSACNVGALLRLVHTRTTTLIRGQVADLGAHCTSIVGYERIAGAKSGPLLSLPLELPLAVAGLNRFGNLAREAADAFAIGYQISDDLDDISQSEPAGVSVGTNVVRVLQTTHPRAEAELIATRHAQVALLRAEQKANQLPHGSGASLSSYAAKLRNSLGRGRQP